MSNIILKLTLFIGIIFIAKACQIQNCQQCSNDGTLCTSCNSGYSLSQSQDQCNSSSSSSSPNIGLIIGVSIAIVFGVLFCYYIIRKCYQCTKDGANEGAETHNFTYGPSFGCMGMVDPMNCVVNQYNINNNNMCSDKDDYYYNVQIYNKFKNLNEKCLDSRNDCDRCAFKLDRKENLFPDWATQSFEKYQPQKPSKKQQQKAQFARYFTLIPLNVLELKPEELKSAQEQPLLELIKKNSVDDKLVFQKQESNSEQYSDKDETASTSCAYKVRSLSLNSEYISVRGDEINTEEIFSQQSECSKTEKGLDTESSDQVIVCIDNISSLPTSQKCVGLSSRSAFATDACIIEMSEHNVCQEQKNNQIETKKNSNVSLDKEMQTLKQQIDIDQKL